MFNIDPTLEVFLIVAAAILLIVVTAAESILIALSRSRARVLAGREGRRMQDLPRYIQERAAILSTLRLARNIAVILGVAAATHLTVRQFGAGWQSVLVMGLVALVVIGLLEGIPEVLTARNPDLWAPFISPIIRILSLLLWLPSRALDLPGVALARLLPAPSTAHDDEEGEELLRLVELEESNGGIEPEERQMIRGIFKLVETTAREIMVPRIDIAGVEAHSAMTDVQRLVVERGYSRIPLYEESIDNIVGVIYAKDVLRHLHEGTQPASLKDLARPPYFIPETKKVDELLAALRQSKIHIAIVVDEYGGTAGIVTTEDIIEEIVGEIVDEYDVEEAAIQKVSEEEAILDARVSIDALNELFDVELSDEEYDTVGGIVYSELGRVPNAGDEVRVDGIVLHVLSVIGRRIKKIKVTRLQPETVEG